MTSGGQTETASPQDAAARAAGKPLKLRFYGKANSVRDTIICFLFPEMIILFRQHRLSWAVLFGFILAMELFRRHLPKIANEEFPQHIFLAGAVIVVVLAGLTGYLRHQDPLWLILGGSALVLVLFWAIVKGLRIHWDICEDRVVQHRFFRRTVFPLSEIVYVGPMKGQASRFDYFAQHILIENEAGKRIIVRTPRYAEFLAEMRKRLPLVTLNL